MQSSRILLCGGIFFNLLLHTACRDTVVEKTNNADSLQKHSDSVLSAKNVSGKDSIWVIVFPEMTIQTNTNAVLKTNHHPSSDAIEIDASEADEFFDGKQINVESSILKDITVSQAYETSVTIEKEEHFNLTDWKHYRSDWVTLRPVRTNHYIGTSYTEKERRLFPAVTVDELKAYLVATFKHGHGLSDHINQIKSVQDPPSAVEISRQFIRITGTRKDTGEKVSRLIVLNALMGC
jgi:hypothetical protein